MAKPGAKSQRRITFNEVDAAHLYKWGFAYWLNDQNKISDVPTCLQCVELGNRLEAFIGRGEAARLRDLARKNP